MSKLCLLLLLLFSCAIQADNAKASRAKLDHIYPVGQFRIFYTLEGIHALPIEHQEDQNHNAIPDYIEHLALKLQAAMVLYTEVFGLTHPLANKRYQGRARYLDVHVLTMDNKGSVGDEISNFRYQKLSDKTDQVLIIKLANNLRDQTMTPPHELFHVFQNGYTMFKNRWYTEGTARWAEYAFKEGVGAGSPLPNSQQALAKLVEEDYGASVFWNRLAYLCDRNAGQFPLPAIAQQQITSYPPPFEDNSVHGYHFIKHLLENLQEQSDKVTQERGYAAYNWDEDDQKYNPNNHVPIFCAVKQAIRQICDAQQQKEPELLAFIQAVDIYTQQRCD